MKIYGIFLPGAWGVKNLGGNGSDYWLCLDSWEHELCCLNKLFGTIRGRKMVLDSIDLQFSNTGQLHVMPMHTNIWKAIMPVLCNCSLVSYSPRYQDLSANWRFFSYFFWQGW